MSRSKVFLFLLIFIVGYLFWRFYSLANFFLKKERLNIIIYDSSPAFLSFDLKDNLNYYVSLPLDYKVKVPGGYESYRIGSLGKLAYLETDPDLLRRSFSLLFANPVDFYFYSDLSRIFYKEISKQQKNREVKTFSLLKSIFLYKSNASFFDKLFLLTRIIASLVDFEPLRIRKDVLDGNNKVNLSKFHKKIQGDFYNRKIREENKKIKIYYNKKYSAAVNLAAIFEGMGIDVLGFKKVKDGGGCKVKERRISITEKVISQVFNCKTFFEKDVEDNLIKFYLGKELEEKWK